MSFTNYARKNDQTVTFTMEPTHVAYANTLRRLMMTGVETIGFRADMTDKGTTSDVKVIANDTPMTNEMFAHRIGLLPVHVPDPLAWKADEYTFRLSVEAEKETSRDVTCADFKILRDPGGGRELEEVPWNKLFPPHPITRETCLLATLPPGGGKIALEAKASLGTGRENARWQPTSQCTYTYTRDADNVARMEAHLRKWLSEAKKQNLDDLKKGEEPLVSLLREFNTMEVNRVFKENEKGEPYSFDFVVESVGVLDPAYIVRRACEVGHAMVTRYVNIHTAGNKLPDELVILPTTDCDMVGYDFLLKGHDHTLGNLLQTWLAENHMDMMAGAGAGAGEEKARISFAGYAVPHPLRDEMVVRIGVEDGKEETARRAFAQACKGCADMFEALRSAWEVVSKGTPMAGRKLRQSAAAGANAATSGITAAQQAKARSAMLAATAELQKAPVSSAVVKAQEAVKAALAVSQAPATTPSGANAVRAAVEAAAAKVAAAAAAAAAASGAGAGAGAGSVAEANAPLQTAKNHLDEANASLSNDSWNDEEVNEGGPGNNGASSSSKAASNAASKAASNGSFGAAGLFGNE